jgi:hypothetical protein
MRGLLELPTRSKCAWCIISAARRLYKSQRAATVIEYSTDAMMRRKQEHYDEYNDAQNI